VSAAAPEVGARRGLPTWFLAGAGLVLLLSRAVIQPSAPMAVLMFGAIGAGSLAGPASRDRSRLRPAAVLAIGIGAVGLIWFATGPPPLVPRGPLLAAVAVNSLAAIAEEAFFRRFLYDRALTRVGAAGAIAVTAVLFAAIHIPIYGTSVFWVDLGAGLLFGWQRWASGTWAVPAATHVFANLLVTLR
jgi:membrane protease YdiL (CAAX protease family)